MQEQILPIQFHGDTLVMVTHGKLAGWMYSINPNKMAEHLRDKVPLYFGGAQ